jgi:probable HAF family extracellular repeat protein
MRILSLHRLGTVVLVLGSLGTSAAQAATYHLIELGKWMEPTGLNDRDEVPAIDPVYHVVLGRNGHWHPLPMPAGGSADDESPINNRGDVAGSIGGLHRREIPGYWPRGGKFTPVPLPPDATPWRNAIATGISDHRVIVGNYDTTTRPACFRWSAADGSVDLGVMGNGDYCYATAINDAGQIVGGADNEPGGLAHAFLYENGAFQDLGTLDGVGTSATDINRQGDVVGVTATTSVLWKNGQMIDLGAGSPYVTVNLNRLNDRDEAVGSGTDAAGNLHALLYADGKLIELDTAVENLNGCQLYVAQFINNFGVIVGFGSQPFGDGIRSLSFMLVPLP